MSFLKRVFGGKDVSELRTEGEALFESGDLGAAKLAFEKAFDKSKNAPADDRALLRERIDACADGIAERRIAAARAYLADGERELAHSELEGAIETAATGEMRARARAVVEEMERAQAVREAEDVHVQITDEERLAVVAGSWEDAQAEEYDEYGEPMEKAVLLLQDEKPAEARALLETILTSAEEPRYLWLEVGRARILDGDIDGGGDALRKFLDALEEEEGGEARLAAHRELARIADEKGDFDTALAEYQAAIVELPEDPRPFYDMGQFFRLKGYPKEAVKVLAEAAALMSQVRPDFRVLTELGLAQRDAGKDAAAMESLEEVVKIFTEGRYLDYPTEPTTALAELCEKHKKLERAADLWGLLARGSDRPNHLRYHREAGRLLAKIGLAGEARRMYQRAHALAEGNEEERAKIDAALAKLDPE